LKRARPPLPSHALSDPAAILTTVDVARLLRVHPKHIYRLLRRGLPGHRVGGEWRFFSDEVQRWSGARSFPDRPTVAAEGGPPAPTVESGPPPFLAANGDIAVEQLLSHVKGVHGASVGFVQADRGEALDLLRRGAVLAAGCHGKEIAGVLDGQRLAFIHLLDRQVGLAVRRGVRLSSLRQLTRWRLASRPETAGVRGHFDDEARRRGLDPRALHSSATVLPSHRDVVCALARDEADVGLASVAWANRVGLSSVPLYREPYGLLVRASLLGDPRIVRLCEVAQSPAFRRDVGAVAGYDARLTGTISYQSAARDAS
jgi:putative molybdopterin biosynthesis protein